MPVPPVAHAAALAGEGFVRRMPWPGDDAADLVVPRAQAEQVRGRLVDAGAELAGQWAFEALRVAALRPRLGFETDHRTIPHEVGWIGPAVHLQKGCYRGQETVARVQNLGKPPRRLVRLLLSGDSEELPEPGTPVLLDGRHVGFLGTAVHHFEYGPVALAVIKRSVGGESGLYVNGSAVSVDTG
jgi:folate-binding protein YgfZ